MKQLLRILALAVAMAAFAGIDAYALDGKKCIECHSGDEMKNGVPELYEAYLQWKSSPHYSSRVGCYDCHGGNTDGVGKDEMHAGRKDLKDAPTVVETCGVCHQGQRDAFKQSKHFKAIMDNGAAPSCVTCHGSRKVSKLDPLDVPDKCAQCHNAKTNNHPDVPKKAAEVFMLYETIQDGIATTTIELLKAQAAGKNIDEKRRALMGIHQIVDGLTVSWHTFDLDQATTTLNPLQTSLYMTGVKGSFGGKVFKILAGVALSLMIVLFAWGIIDRLRAPKQ